jgi:hypothetical protein
MSLGQDLWRKIIAKHGVDRCPTVEGQALWACGEMGELAQEIVKSRFAGRNPGEDPKVVKEFADAGLSLHGLGVKLGLDLDEEMGRVVDQETRRFA